MRRLITICFTISYATLLSDKVYAQSLPGSADPGRVLLPSENDIKRDRLPKQEDESIKPEEVMQGQPGQPEFTLHSVDIEGATAFSESALQDIWAGFLSQKVSRDTLLMLAGQITERYRNKGYFLSRAFIPAQKIEDGKVTIQVVEGYVAKVEFDSSKAQNFVTGGLVSKLTSKRPVSAYDLESFMLGLNEIPGFSYKAVVEPFDGKEKGAVKISIQTSSKKGMGMVSFDNNGSRYIGPYQAAVIYQRSLVPFQQTTLTAMSSLPMDEMKSFAFQHKVPVHPNWDLRLNGTHVSTWPGATLDSSDIEGRSAELGIGFSYYAIRQWQQNLIFYVDVDSRHTKGDVLDNNPLVREHINKVVIEAEYSVSDQWHGYNHFSLLLNKGLEAISATDAGDANLSRAGAEPDFMSFVFEISRQQSFGEHWGAMLNLNGQYASEPLFSAEEFGYGGQMFGRAYDPSEITGDSGLAASIEVKYLGIEPVHGFSFTPYSFYDIGKVWNEDSGGQDLYGSSIGLGMALGHKSGVNAKAGLAWPIGRDVSTPIFGDPKDPRITFSLSTTF